MFTHQKSKEELQKWTFKPYRGVFPSQGSLLNVPSGLDHVSKKGCRSQALSSWASSSLSYIVSAHRGSLSPPQHTSGLTDRTQCSNTMTDVFDLDDVEGSIKSTKIPVYGTTPSEKFMSLIPEKQREAIQMKKLHYIDHMVLNCHMFDRYHTMVLAERVLYHANNLAKYIVDNFKFKLIDANRLIFGMEQPPIADDYIPDAGKMNYPPTNSHAQSKMTSILKYNATADTKQLYISTLANALVLSRWLDSMNLRTEIGQDYTVTIKKIVQINPSTGASVSTYTYYDFRNASKDSEDYNIIESRIKKLGIVHCKHTNPTNIIYMDSHTRQERSSEQPQPKMTAVDLGYTKESLSDFAPVGVAERCPIRYMETSMVPSLFERANGYMTTPTYNSLSEKMEERNQQGSLGAMVKKSIIRDPASALSLIKTLMGEPASAMDVAPLVRMINVINSLSLESAVIDLTPFQFYRNYQKIDHSVHIVNVKRNNIDQMASIAMYLDDFIDYIAGDIELPIMQRLAPQNIDKDWIAIPVTTEILHSRAIVPYTVSFLDSIITDGSINWFFRGVISTIETQSGSEQGMAYTCIPASNTVRIPGVLKFVYVMVDQHGMRNTVEQNTITIAGRDVNIYNRNVNENETTNFNEIFEAYWTAGAYHNILSDYNRAYSHFVKINLLPGVQSLAMSLVAESRLASKQGMLLPPGLPQIPPNKNDYSYQTAVGGGWYLGTSDQFVAAHIDKRSKISAMAGTLDSLLTELDVFGHTFQELLEGYNFSSLSSWLVLPDGEWDLHDDIQTLTTGINARVFLPLTSSHNSKYKVGYTISQSTSLHRLATTLGLYVRDTQHVILYSAPTITAWSHMHSISIQSSMSLALILNNIPLHYWSGTGSFGTDSFSYNQLRTSKNDMLFNILHHSDTLNILSQLNVNTRITDGMELYYNLEVGNIMFFSSVPTHITLLIQWYRKTIEDVYQAESNTIWFLYNRTECSGFQVDQKKPWQRIIAESTIDIARYVPTSFLIGDDKMMLGVWFETIQLLTMRTTSPQTAIHADAYHAYPSTHAPYDIMSPVVDPRRMYVLSTTSQSSDANLLAIAVNNLDWPDPPDVPTSTEVPTPTINTPPEPKNEVQPAASTETAIVRGVVEQTVLPNEGQSRPTLTPLVEDVDV